MQDDNTNPDQVPQSDNTTNQPERPIEPPTVTPSPSLNTAPAPKKPKKGLMVLFSVVIVLLIAAVVVLAFMLLRPSTDKNSNTAADTTSTKQTDTTPSTQNNVKTTSFTYGGANISVQHPATWQVDQSSGSSSGDTTAANSVPSVTITSDKGNVLHMFIPSGIGGTCSPDSTTYTVTHTIATATPGLYFVQYEYTYNSEKNVDLTVELFDNGKQVPNAGDTGTDTCSNIPHYSIVNSGQAGVMLTVTDSTASSILRSNLTYDQIASDPDFLAMLKSLKVE